MKLFRIGVSRCLLGEYTRYDGKNEANEYLIECLERDPHIQFIRICPEAECGMGIPREPIHLQGDPSSPNLVGNLSGRDMTMMMQQFIHAKLNAWELLSLDGCILKKNSPSCGSAHVKVYRDSGEMKRDGQGLFAAALMKRFPQLPVIDESDLADPILRERFFNKIFKISSKKEQ